MISSIQYLNKIRFKKSWKELRFQARSCVISESLKRNSNLLYRVEYFYLTGTQPTVKL